MTSIMHMHGQHTYLLPTCLLCCSKKKYPTNEKRTSRRQTPCRTLSSTREKKGRSVVKQNIKGPIFSPLLSPPLPLHPRQHLLPSKYKKKETTGQSHQQKDKLPVVHKLNAQKATRADGSSGRARGKKTDDFQLINRTTPKIFEKTDVFSRGAIDRSRKQNTRAARRAKKARKHENRTPYCRGLVFTQDTPRRPSTRACQQKNQLFISSAPRYYYR